MITWHRISPSGEILDTRRAPDKATAEQLLKGSGYVVSAASWKLDVYRFRPVQTVVTDTVQVQQRTGAPVLKGGLLGTAQTAQRLGITERKLRYLSERGDIQPQRIPYGKRYVWAYTPAQVRALRQCL